MFWPPLWAEVKTEGGNLRGCAGPDLLSAARCLFVRPHPLCHGHVLLIRVLLFSCTHSFLHKSIYSVLRALCSLAPRLGAGFWVRTLRRSSGTWLLGPMSWSSTRNLLSHFIGSQTKSRKIQEQYLTASHMLFFFWVIAQGLGGTATLPPTLFKAGLERAQDTTSQGHQAGRLEQGPFLWVRHCLCSPLLQSCWHPCP